MSNARSQLRNIIDSGRSIAIDCYAIGRTIDTKDKIGRLFKTDVMNKTVVFKRFQSGGSKRKDGPISIDTTVYFPYDFDKVYDGGESVALGEPTFQKTLALKISNGAASKEMMKRIAQDLRILHLFGSMHSLDPFIFRSKAEQIGIDKVIHPAYFAISATEWQAIREPIREKISRLVSKALGGAGGSAQDTHVERFLTKIWEAKDIDGIEPFIKAMQIDAERAPEIFFAWKAVCYYQVRYGELLEDLKTLFKWVGDNNLCFPSDFVTLRYEEKRHLERMRELLRNRMRESYVEANKVLNEYEQSYNLFVHEGQPQGFMSFLQNSDASYLSLASNVSVATHSINLWKWYVEHYGQSMPNENFSELFDGLNNLFGVEYVSEEITWGSESAA
ncbi:MAG: hypothetical protein OXT06_07220 [Rhodospirillaceae bacterium]|nr:hypothetical protein [Rhodospirillaceae bacterium]MDD9928629.1 hypothetical protein [Rhodospirillaceae bacterium]